MCFRAGEHHIKFIYNRETSPMNNRAQKVIDYFYEEGEIDYIFLAQIMASVSYDENDVELNKSVSSKLSDVRNLLNYIVSTGDFKLGKSVTNDDGLVEYIEFDQNIDEFWNDLKISINNEGINSIEVNYGFWIKKIKGRSAPSSLPKSINSIFA